MILREFIFALQGFDGEIFTKVDNVDDDKQRSHRFQVNPTLSSIFHPAEVAIIDSMLTTASECCSLSEFVSERLAIQCQAEERGMFFSALRFALDNVLDEYKTVLADLEDLLLDSDKRDVQLSHVQYVVAPYNDILSSANRLVREIREAKVHGILIMDSIVKACQTTFGRVHEMMQRIMKQLNIVLYNLLATWLFYGYVVDPHAEFFIRPRVNSPEEFQLHPDMVPGHIPMALAERIYFIGDSIRHFGRRQSSLGVSQNHIQIFNKTESSYLSQLSQLASIDDQASVHDLTSLVESLGTELSGNLFSLVTHTAHLDVELMRIRHFFLIGHGSLFCDFASRCCHILDRSLEDVVVGSAQYDVMSAFKSACSDSLTEEECDSLTDAYFRVYLSDSEQSGNSSKSWTWSAICMDYRPVMPCNLVITEKAISDKYSPMFTFLMQVKRAQMLLNQAWSALKIQLKTCRNPKRVAVLRRINEVRYHMAFVVDNLQQYFMADVIEPQHQTLMAQLSCPSDGGRTFEHLSFAHDVFLSSVTSQLFIESKDIHHCLLELVKTCANFGLFVDNKLASVSNGDLLDWHGDIVTLFSRQTTLLFDLLTSLMMASSVKVADAGGPVHLASKGKRLGGILLSSAHLTQLLLRIDFNYFFSRRGHDSIHVSSHV